MDEENTEGYHSFSFGGLYILTFKSSRSTIWRRTQELLLGASRQVDNFVFQRKIFEINVFTLQVRFCICLKWVDKSKVT